MKITIEDLQRQISINPATIIRAARKTLLYKKVKRVDLSIVFVTDQRIKSLNKKYLNREYTTDVLSFDLRDPTNKANELLTIVPLNKQLTSKQSSRYWSSSMSLERERPIKGEIIISTATAVRNAREYGTTTQGEIVLYVIHGILHLLGFDDHSSKDIKRMRREEKKILKAIGYDRKK